MSGLELLFLFGLAALAANLPFWSRRQYLLFLIPLKRNKHFFWVLLEWGFAYGVWMGLALLTESRQQAIHPQHWQFWVVSLCLFALLSLPGFISVYLWPRHKNNLS